MANDNTIVWPNKAKAAVMVTIEFDAEFIWLNMDADTVNRPKTLSMGEYGAKRGLARILNVLDRFGIKATFFVPGEVAEKYPEQVMDIIDRGHEIGHHGYKHENFSLLTKDEQRASLLKGSETLEKICGVRPVGFRAPEGDITTDTHYLIEEIGMKYSSSMRGDDRPYFISLDGRQTDVIEIPRHYESEDFPYFAFNFKPAFPVGQGRIANYSQVLSIWEDEFIGHYKYGLNYVITLHPQSIGTPGRIALLEKLLFYINRFGNVWFCTGSEMADFWRRR